MLRREFGISAYEAEHVLPAWEREMLLRRYVDVKQIESGNEEGLAGTSGEPLSDVPREFGG